MTCKQNCTEHSESSLKLDFGVMNNHRHPFQLPVQLTATMFGIFNYPLRLQRMTIVFNVYGYWIVCREILTGRRKNKKKGQLSQCWLTASHRSTLHEERLASGRSFSC